MALTVRLFAGQFPLAHAAPPNTQKPHAANNSQTLNRALNCMPMASTGAKYRGATVEDLEPPAALSVRPGDPIAHAMFRAFESDYTHLTVIGREDRALLGYISIPRLQQLLKEHKVNENDSVETAMQRFRRRGKVYKTITPNTPLEELEAFFAGGADGKSPQDFAVVTDMGRKFVVGIATKADLDEFVRRRPG